jgi:hypothetical protein
VFDLPTSKPRYWFVQNQGVLVCSKPRYWFVQNRLHTYMVCSYAYSQTGPKNVTELQGCPSFLGPSKICLYTFLHICTYIRYIKYMHRYNKRVSLFTLKRQVWNCHTLYAHYLLFCITSTRDLNSKPIHKLRYIHYEYVGQKVLSQHLATVLKAHTLDSFYMFNSILDLLFPPPNQ